MSQHTLTATDYLLHSVVANPADDLPRLILADRLEETGQPERAEFIRVQCELSRYFEPHEWNRGGELQSREAELFHAYGWPWSGEGIPSGWFDDLPAPWGQMRVLLPHQAVEDPFPNYIVRRGFVAEVRCQLADWSRIGPQVMAAHPVEVVRLTDREPMRGDPTWWGPTSGGYWYTWVRWPTGSRNDPNYIPSDLFDRLTCEAHGRVNGRNRTDVQAVLTWHKTEASANAALSAAALELARSDQS